MPDDDDYKRLLREPVTDKIDPADVKPSWALAIAMLREVSPWAVMALRLGTLALVQECTRSMAQTTATFKHVGHLRELTDALARMPFEAPPTPDLDS